MTVWIDATGRLARNFPLVSFVDQRQNERFDAQLPVMVRRADEEVVGVTENISLGGARLRVELEPAPRVGDRIRVQIRLPNLEQPLQADAAVRWRDPLDASMLGIAFVTGFRAKETFALGKYIESLSGPQGDA